MLHGGSRGARLQGPQCHLSLLVGPKPQIQGLFSIFSLKGVRKPEILHSLGYGP